MSTAERDRTVLHQRLDEALGPDATNTLMGYLPPVGWADVATKTDLEIVRTEVASLEHKLTASFERALRQAVLALVAAMFASVGAAVAITQLLNG